jgi:hypothetical protein
MVISNSFDIPRKAACRLKILHMPCRPMAGYKSVSLILIEKRIEFIENIIIEFIEKLLSINSINSINEFEIASIKMKCFTSL